MIYVCIILYNISPWQACSLHNNRDGLPPDASQIGDALKNVEVRYATRRSNQRENA